MGGGNTTAHHDVHVNKKAIAKLSEGLYFEINELRDRVGILEVNIKLIMDKLDAIQAQIKVVKKVTKDRKGNTIIVVGK